MTFQAHALPFSPSLSFVVCARQPIIHDLNICSFDCGTVDANRRGCINILEFGTWVAVIGDDIEVQLKELRKQVEEDRESRIAYAEARTESPKLQSRKQRIKLQSRKSSSIK